MANNPLKESAGKKLSLERCRSFLAIQLEGAKRPVPLGVHQPSGPAITLSYLTGSGAHVIADLLTGVLQQSEAPGQPAWTAFDRHLVETVLQEHNLPADFAWFMPEDQRSYFQELVEELVGLRPPSWVLVPKVAETILHLANVGRVVLVGRGAHIITARLPNIFHIRLIASLPKRIARIQMLNNWSPEEAAAFIAKEDRARARYLKAYYHAKADDDLSFHLVVNTDRLPFPDVARLIADGARRYFQNNAVTEDQGIPFQPAV